MHRAIPIAAAVLAMAVGLLDFFRDIELQTYDLRVEATVRPSAPSRDVVLIAIDNQSIRRMEPLVGPSEAAIFLQFQLPSFSGETSTELLSVFGSGFTCAGAFTVLASAS
jgi:CHASE2 domain-containing sensor protein